MKNNDTFLESDLFIKIKEILKATNDKEFFKLMTNYLIKSNFLKFETNLLDYYNILLDEKLIDKTDIVEIYFDALNQIKKMYNTF